MTTFNPGAVGAVAEALHRAATDRAPIPQISVAHGPPGLELAYDIQKQLVDLRKSPVVGFKMGFTSLAKMKQMGVHDPIYGRLVASMQIDSGGTFDTTACIHPRIEPEIAFRTCAPIRHGMSASAIADAISHVTVALEIIDSRYRDFQFQLDDVVADNASSCAFVLPATWTPIDKAGDLGNLGILLEENGRIVECASSAAILEHPLRAIDALARLLGRFEPHTVIQPGTLLLAGAATAAIPLRPGAWVRARAERLGDVELFARPA